VLQQCGEFGIDFDCVEMRHMVQQLFGQYPLTGTDLEHLVMPLWFDRVEDSADCSRVFEKMLAEALTRDMHRRSCCACGCRPCGPRG